MLADKEIAPTSNAASGCTFQSEPYTIDVEGTVFRIHDTAGLNEGDQGRVPHIKAVRDLYKLIQRLDGVSLLIYCLRGRVVANAKANWMLFHKVICRESVPIVAVVTGLEEEKQLDDWWNRKENQKSFEQNQMKPKAVGCAVAIRGKGDRYLAEYEESRAKIRNLIKQYHAKDPWSTDRSSWYLGIYQRSSETGLCGFAQRMELAVEVQLAFDDYFKDCNVEVKEAEKIKKAILKIEKKMGKD